MLLIVNRCPRHMTESPTLNVCMLTSTGDRIGRACADQRAGVVGLPLERAARRSAGVRLALDPNGVLRLAGGRLRSPEVPDQAPCRGVALEFGREVAHV